MYLYDTVVLVIKCTNCEFHISFASLYEFFLRVAVQTLALAPHNFSPKTFHRVSKALFNLVNTEVQVAELRFFFKFWYPRLPFICKGFIQYGRAESSSGRTHGFRLYSD